MFNFNICFCLYTKIKSQRTKYWVVTGVEVRQNCGNAIINQNECFAVKRHRVKCHN